MQTILVGIAAGIAAALMFLAPVGGTVLAFPLFILTGLPIGLAGLGWGIGGRRRRRRSPGRWRSSPRCRPSAAAAFLLLFAAPVFWVARLALLSRPADGAEPDAPREWYPLGRLLMHLAAAVAIGVVLVGILIGFDRATLTAEVTQALVELFAAHADDGDAADGRRADAVRAVLPGHHAVLGRPPSWSSSSPSTCGWRPWWRAPPAACSGRARRCGASTCPTGRWWRWPASPCSPSCRAPPARSPGCSPARWPAPRR